MLPPPGFVKPIWRGWEQPDDVRANLAVAVSAIERSIGSCHREKVVRKPTQGACYVHQVPHRSELLPKTSRKYCSKGEVKLYCNFFF